MIVETPVPLEVQEIKPYLRRRRAGARIAPDSGRAERRIRHGERAPAPTPPPAPPPSHRVSVLIAPEERETTTAARGTSGTPGETATPKLLIFHLRMQEDVARDVAVPAEAEKSKARPDDSIRAISFSRRGRYRSRIALPDEWRCHPVVN